MIKAWGVDMTQVARGLSSVCVSCVLAAIVAVAFISAAVLTWTQFF